MNDSTTIARLLREHGTPIPDQGYPSDEYDCCAEHLVAAGVRAPARVIEAVEELDALPVGSVVLVLSPIPRAFTHAGWGYGGRSMWWAAGPIRDRIPSNEVLDGDKALVLHEPTSEADRG